MHLVLTLDSPYEIPEKTYVQKGSEKKPVASVQKWIRSSIDDPSVEEVSEVTARKYPLTVQWR